MTPSRNDVPSVSLELPLDSRFVPLVVAVTQKSAAAFGADEAGAGDLALAGEEVFAYVCAAAKQGGSLALRCVDGVYFVQIELAFQLATADFRAFNLTATVSPDDESSLAEVGLLIAARVVDRLTLAEEPGGRLRLSLKKEKSYPVPAVQPLARVDSGAHCTLATPRPEHLKALAHALASECPAAGFPAGFAVPGKLVDMVQSGEYGLLVALDARGRLGGAVAWCHSRGRRMVECFGPYIFGAAEDTATELLDGCISAVARTEALGVLRRHGGPPLPEGYFEELGALGGDPEGQVHYRMLREDLGTSVWAHPALIPFLDAEYQRLALAREVVPVRDEGERQSVHSVFAAEHDRSRGAVTLRPLWPGADAADNLRQHLAVLRRSGVEGLLFELDLGVGWQAALGGVLAAAGFVPQLLLPYAGEADVVVYCHAGG